MISKTTSAPPPETTLLPLLPHAATTTTPDSYLLRLLLQLLPQLPRATVAVDGTTPTTPTAAVGRRFTRACPCMVCYKAAFKYDIWQLDLWDREWAAGPLVTGANRRIGRGSNGCSVSGTNLHAHW